jgi:periplasmic protein TonB
MLPSAREYSLRAYELHTTTNTSLVDRIYFVVVVVCLAFFMGSAAYLHTVKLLPEPIERTVEAIRARFVIEEKPTVRKEEPKREKPRPVTEAKPIDLTEKPLLGQKEDVAAEAPKPGAQVARPVFGLRRVFATGLGAQGGMSDAVIGKLGNTLNKDFDTLTATPRDVKGQVVSVTTITSAPTIKKVVKPDYTREMVENKVEGVIRVKVLVDVDGRIKKAIPLNDLGFGTAALAVKVCTEMEFVPAKRGEEAVAVWIIIPIRFVLLG